VLVSVAYCSVACKLFVDNDGLSGEDGASSGLPSDGAANDGTVADGASSDGASPDGADAAEAGGPTCPPTDLPTTCGAAYLGDARNCCVQGRDCGGGACVNGACQPVTVVSDATSDARLIGIRGDTLVWATGCTHELRRVRTDGAGNTALPAGSNCTPTLALNGTDRAYWIEFDGPNLNTAPIDGSQPASVIATVPGSGVRSDFARLAVDATRAYWATTTPAAIWFAPLSQSGGAPSVVAKTGVTSDAVQQPFGVAVDDTHLYWSDKTDNKIRRRTLASLGTDVLADVVSTDTGPRHVALDAQRAYWLTSDGLVRARAKDLKEPAVTLASGQTAAESVIVDDRYVYWTTWVASGAVSRVRKTGGPVEVLASGQSYAYGITQDCSTIYWTNHANFNTGQVMKVVK
jgi:hypothetical protein